MRDDTAKPISRPDDASSSFAAIFHMFPSPYVWIEIEPPKLKSLKMNRERIRIHIPTTEMDGFLEVQNPDLNAIRKISYKENKES